MARIAIISLLLNFFWEMAEMPAYSNMPAVSIRTFLICAGAAAADTVYILALYRAGRIATHDARWPASASRQSIAAVLMSGFVVALAAERFGLAQRWWAYTAAMPRLPFGAGLWPTLQLMFLPLAAFRLAFRRQTGHR